MKALASLKTKRKKNPMPERLTDQEIICTHMEPSPRSATRSRDSEHGYWRLIGSDRKAGHWIPAPVYGAFTLSTLHRVEDSLTSRQRQYYCILIFQWCCLEAKSANLIEDLLTPNRWGMIHADAAVRTKALATVLREDVEKARRGPNA